MRSKEVISKMGVLVS